MENDINKKQQEQPNQSDQPKATDVASDTDKDSENLKQELSKKIEVRESARRVSEKLEEEKNVEIDLSWRKFLSFYALPFSILIIFGAIIFTLIIPGINDALVTASSIDSVRNDISNLDERLAVNRELEERFFEISSILENIDTIIPEGVTEVVNFRQEIVRTATDDYGLNVNNSALGETLLSSAVDPEDNPNAEALSIIEIPADFSIDGSLPQIQEFITAIQQTQDFIIIEEMQLVSSADTENVEIAEIDEGNWQLDIRLIKYQFPGEGQQEDLREIYAQVPPTVEINQEVVEFVEQKIE